jgi:putative DNA primase/helicase
MAKDIIKSCNSYTEISPSKKGIRIIFKTNTKFDKNDFYTMNSKIGLEIYVEGQTNKYVSITTNVINDKEINQVDLTYILNKYMRKKNNFTLEDAIKQDTKLKELWENKAPGSGSNESELDLALCSKLAYYLNNDKEAIEESFTSSPYFESKDKEHKDKWRSRDDYRNSTINKSIEKSKIEKIDQQDNDLENSKLLVEKYGKIIAYNENNNTWLNYDGYRWVESRKDSKIRLLCENIINELKFQLENETNEEVIKKLIKRINRMSNNQGMTNMINQSISKITKYNYDFDKEPHLLNTRSGIVNLKTGEILNHDYTYYMTNMIDIEIDKNPPKKFLSFLYQILNNNIDLVNYMCMLFGYMITGETKEQSIYMLVGDGSNGKSVLLRVLRDIFSYYAKNGSIDMVMEIRNKSDRSEQDFATLKGKRLVLLEEGDMNAKLNEGKVKNMTGESNLSARFLYGEQFDFKPEFKLLIASNYKPYISGTDFGIWRRIKIIPFEVQIEESKQDLDLIYKLKEEYGSILYWIIQGSKLWYQKQRLPKIEIINSAIDEYKKSMDIIDLWTQDNCEEDVNSYEKPKDLYIDYVRWAKETNRNIMTNTSFGIRLGKKYKKIKKFDGNYYEGIKLKNNMEIKLKSIYNNNDI